MPYYHIYIHYEDKKGKVKTDFLFDCSRSFVEQKIASRYSKNKPFLFSGIVIHPSRIFRIAIFESKGAVKELVLPNGKNPLDEEDNKYIVNCFDIKMPTEKVSNITYDFITSPPQKEEPTETPTKPLGEKKEVFIVHGRDEVQALRLQKYLYRNLKIRARMFEDFREVSGSNTIIEQLEYVKDNVGYTFVVVTPDDYGCLCEDIRKCRAKMLEGKRSVTVKNVCKILDNLKTRARQNVVFEHGLFIGALGRDRVCCLFQEDTEEKPTDIDGILYVGFKKSVKETFTEITEKLKKIGLIKT